MPVAFTDFQSGSKIWIFYRAGTCRTEMHLLLPRFSVSRSKEISSLTLVLDHMKVSVQVPYLTGIHFLG